MENRQIIVLKIIDNYESALFKLRKIIRVLDVLMFNEGGSGIGSAKIETVRPWYETLKEMEQRVSSKHRTNHHKNNQHSPGQLNNVNIILCCKREYLVQSAVIILKI